MALAAAARLREWNIRSGPKITSFLTNSGARYDLHASIWEYTPVQGMERALVSLGARMCVFHEHQIFIWGQRLTQ